MTYQEHCDRCGKFVGVGNSGVSWSRSYGYCMDGSPDLHDPEFRCSPCTDKFGIGESNCANPNAYRGRNEMEKETT